ncbi:MAG: hypothetical protein ACRDQ5_15890 [Sciscionella sp.]
MHAPNAVFRRMVDRFEIRGAYVPGEEDRSLVPGRDLGWLIAGWLVSIGLFVVFFAIAV